MKIETPTHCCAALASNLSDSEDSLAVGQLKSRRRDVDVAQACMAKAVVICEYYMSSKSAGGRAVACRLHRRDGRACSSASLRQSLALCESQVVLWIGWWYLSVVPDGALVVWGTAGSR